MSTAETIKATDESRWGYEWGTYETMQLLAASQHFGIPEGTLREWVNEGKVFSTKIRRRVYVCTQSLRRYMRGGDA